jgi:hypothetical protein
MSPQEKALRHHLEHMPTALRLLDELMAAQKTSGLEDAIQVFAELQAEKQRHALRRDASKEAREDCANEAKRAAWANHILRARLGQMKKPPRVRAKNEAKS